MGVHLFSWVYFLAIYSPYLLQQLSQIESKLPTMVGNDKLLELVARQETPAEVARQFYGLYGMNYQENHSAHSVPYYQYFSCASRTRD